MSIRVALIGAGRRGQRYLTELVQRSDVTVAAVCDVNHMAAAGAGHISQARVYTRYELLLAQETVDAVILASPAAFHPLIGQAAAERGLHLFLAPPLAVDVPAARRLIAAVQRAQVLCLVDYPGRYQPGAQRARAVFADRGIARAEGRFHAPPPRLELWRPRRRSRHLPEPPPVLLDLWHFIVGRVHTVAPAASAHGGVVLRLEGDPSGHLEGRANFQPASGGWTLSVAAEDVVAQIGARAGTLVWQDAPGEYIPGSGDALAAFFAAVAAGDPRPIRSEPASVLRTLALTIAVREVLTHKRPVEVAEVLARQELPYRRWWWERVLGFLRL